MTTASFMVGDRLVTVTIEEPSKPPLPQYRCSRELAEKVARKIYGVVQEACVPSDITLEVQGAMDAIERDFVRELAQRRVFGGNGVAIAGRWATVHEIVRALCGDTP